MPAETSSRTIAKTAFKFALAGPPAGLLLLLGLIIANAARHPHDQSVHWKMVLVLLPYAPVALAAAYFVGAPAAFVAGAVAHYLLERGLWKGWAALASALVAAATATLTIMLLDEFIVPHPHLSTLPAFGQGTWLAVGAIGALCAATFTLVTSPRSKVP